MLYRFNGYYKFYGLYITMCACVREQFAGLEVSYFYIVREIRERRSNEF